MKKSIKMCLGIGLIIIVGVIPFLSSAQVSKGLIDTGTDQMMYQLYKNEALSTSANFEAGWDSSAISIGVASDATHPGKFSVNFAGFPMASTYQFKAVQVYVTGTDVKITYKAPGINARTGADSLSGSFLPQDKSVYWEVALTSMNIYNYNTVTPAIVYLYTRYSKFKSVN